MRRRSHRSFSAWLTQYGCYTTAALCAAVILGTAVWTGRHPQPAGSPGATSAARLMQQSLADAATPPPSPTPQPFVQPLRTVSVLQPFDDQHLVLSASTGIRKLHDAVDLAGDEGAEVCALSSGIILLVENEEAVGAVEIDHGPVLARYEGLRPEPALKPGMTVAAGQQLGTLAAPRPDEAALGSHLHLRVLRDGQAVDPLLVFTAMP